ncbi:hypothetical protein EG878_17590, partial [Enterococcus faecalis]
RTDGGPVGRLERGRPGVRRAGGPRPHHRHLSAPDQRRDGLAADRRRQRLCLLLEWHQQFRLRAELQGVQVHDDLGHQQRQRGQRHPGFQLHRAVRHLPVRLRVNDHLEGQHQATRHGVEAELGAALIGDGSP